MSLFDTSEKLLKTIGAVVLSGLLWSCATSADRAAYHQAQVDAIKAQVEAELYRKPMVEIEAFEGQNIVISGLSKLKMWYPKNGSSDIQLVKQYQDEYVPVYIAAMNLMGIPISIATQGYFINEILKTTSSTKTNVYNYGNNNSGLQGSTTTGSNVASPFGASSVNSGTGNNSATPTNAVTTTTTTGGE